MEGFIRFSVFSSTEAFIKGKYPLGNLLFFHETSVDKKGARDRLREGMVLAKKANWFCFPSPENRIKFDFHGDGASF